MKAKETNINKPFIIRMFLARWYYFWGHIISRPMLWFGWGFIYPYYNDWMTKSADYDIEGTIWKYVK